MSLFRSLMLSAALCGLCLPAGAADFSDPTWPCIQRKVESLSLGLMWPHPVPETDQAQQPDMLELADALALRRVDLDSLRPQIASFAERHGGDKDQIGQVFARVFGALSKRRGRIIGGIGKFSLSQIALAEKIDSSRIEMSALMSADPVDFDKVDALEERIDWDQLIHSDRQRSITYLCETPQLLERRLFAIAQMLQEYVKD